MTAARVMHPPDPVAGLIAQYHEAVATINGFPVRDGVNGDAECSRFCDEVFDPLRDRIATTHPTTRAGLFALLDLAVREFGHDQSPMMPALIENARDAVKEAAPGAMVPLVEDPIITLWAEWSGLIDDRGLDDLDGEEADRAVNAVIVRIDEIEQQIMSAPARTLPAALAQIDVLNHWDEDGPPLNEPLVSTLARHKENVRAELRRLADAERLTGKVAMGAKVENPVFSLIAASEEFWRGRAEMAQLDPESASYADHFHRLAQSLGELEDRIMATPADAPAGMAVKLRIALDKAVRYLSDTEGEDVYEHPLAVAIKSPLEDAERLSDGGAS